MDNFGECTDFDAEERLGFSFIEASVTPQTPEETLQILNYEQGELAKCYHYMKRYGPQGYLPNVRVKAANVLSMIRMFFEHMGWSFEEMSQLGIEHYLERQADLRKYGLIEQLRPELRGERVSQIDGERSNKIS